LSLTQEEQPFWEIVLIIPNDGPAKQSGFFVGLVQSEKMDRGWQEVRKTESSEQFIVSSVYG
jgi:hypothetical protein